MSATSAAARRPGLHSAPATGTRAAEAVRRPTVVIIGPTPPPYHGMSVFTRMLVSSEILAAAYDVVHVDTADRRSMDNMGRLDLRNVTLALRHAAALARVLARRRPEVVYVEASQNSLAYLRDAVLMGVARAFGARIAIHLHGSAFRSFYESAPAPMRWLVRRTTAWAGAAGVLGGGLRAMYGGLLPPERVHVAPPGVAEPLADEAKLQRGSARGRDDGRAGEVVVTYLGMLCRPKGIVELLEAAARVRTDCPAVRFILAGEWVSAADRAAAEAVVAARGLGDVVACTGPVDAAAKTELLRRTDVLVFPGWQPEGLPLVVLEAMAAGIPVVATPMGALPDALADGVHGVLVPARDVDALAGAIAALAADPERRTRMGRAARERYLAEYTEARCVERVVALLDAARGAA